VVVLDSEIGEAFEFDTICLKRHSSGSTSAGTNYDDFQIWVGLTDTDALSPVFEDNFLPGTRTLLFSRDSLYLEAEPNAWIPFELDTPYWYGGSHNLIIEVLWSGGEEIGSECVYTWQWNTGTMRCASGPFSSSSGSLTSVIPLLQLVGEASLDSATFAEVKAEFSGE
jgi:hypothetical protein